MTSSQRPEVHQSLSVRFPCRFLSVFLQNFSPQCDESECVQLIVMYDMYAAKLDTILPPVHVVVLFLQVRGSHKVKSVNQ